MIRLKFLFLSPSNTLSGNSHALPSLEFCLMLNCRGWLYNQPSFKSTNSDINNSRIHKHPSLAFPLLLELRYVESKNKGCNRILLGLGCYKSIHQEARQSEELTRIRYKASLCILSTQFLASKSLQHHDPLRLIRFIALAG